MKKSLLLLPLCVLPLLYSTGCGGGNTIGTGVGTGTGTSAAASQTSSFAGTYIGPFTEAGASGDSGQIALTIASNGTITGRLIDTTSDTTDTITTGQVTSNSTTPSTNLDAVTFTDSAGTFTGSLTLTTTSDTLTGSLANSSSAVTMNFTDGLTSVSGQNAFAGEYHGGFTCNGDAGAPANSMALIISGSGSITGLVSQNSTTPADPSVIGSKPKVKTTETIYTGNITSSNGSTTLAPTGDSKPTKGTLTLSSGVLKGTLLNKSTSTTIVLNETENT